MLSWPDALCERLAAVGRRVVRYDLRDSGESTTTNPEAPTYTLRDLAADAAALSDALGGGPAHLAGIGVRSAPGPRSMVRGGCPRSVATSRPFLLHDDPSELAVHVGERRQDRRLKLDNPGVRRELVDYRRVMSIDAALDQINDTPSAARSTSRLPIFLHAVTRSVEVSPESASFSQTYSTCLLTLDGPTPPMPPNANTEPRLQQRLPPPLTATRSRHVLLSALHLAPGGFGPSRWASTIRG